jgi:hypothetical protein
MFLQQPLLLPYNLAHKAVSYSVDFSNGQYLCGRHYMKINKRLTSLPHVRKQSEGTKLKISKANKGKRLGCTPWNKGKKLSYITGKREHTE